MREHSWKIPTKITFLELFCNLRILEILQCLPPVRQPHRMSDDQCNTSCVTWQCHDSNAMNFNTLIWTDFCLYIVCVVQRRFFYGSMVVPLFLENEKNKTRRVIAEQRSQLVRRQTLTVFRRQSCSSCSEVAYEQLHTTNYLTLKPLMKILTFFVCQKVTVSLVKD